MEWLDSAALNLEKRLEHETEILRGVRQGAQKHSANTANALADKFGCSPQTVRDIWGRRSWSKAKPNNGPYQQA